ncbi:MAG: hypothetical protein ACKV2T_02620 [Kofleriaceae bacterium]
MRGSLTLACLSALVGGAAACGGAPESAPASNTRAASPIATKSGPTDEVVAQVNGRPVWASCVAAQAAMNVRTRAAGDSSAEVARTRALDECIAFELLAQEADKRGLADDAEVIDATRTALVNRVVEVGFEQRYAKAEDLGERFDKWFRDNAFRMSRPELRGSAYLRVAGPDDTARPAAQAIYNQLANRTGLFAFDLRPLSKAKKGAPPIEYTVVPDKAASELEPTYRAALFAIPEVGRVAPPVKTPWGWDVILWTGGLPPKETSREDLVAEAFPELRRSMFPVWVAQVTRELGLKPEVVPAGVKRLDEVGP